MLDVMREIEMLDNVRAVRKLKPYCYETTNKQRHQMDGVGVLLRIVYEESIAHLACTRARKSRMNLCSHLPKVK